MVYSQSGLDSQKPMPGSCSSADATTCASVHHQVDCLPWTGNTTTVPSSPLHLQQREGSAFRCQQVRPQAGRRCPALEERVRVVGRAAPRAELVPEPAREGRPKEEAQAHEHCSRLQRPPPSHRARPVAPPSPAALPPRSLRPPTTKRQPLAPHLSMKAANCCARRSQRASPEARHRRSST